MACNWPTAVWGEDRDFPPKRDSIGIDSYLTWRLVVWSSFRFFLSLPHHNPSRLRTSSLRLVEVIYPRRYLNLFLLLTVTKLSWYPVRRLRSTSIAGPWTHTLSQGWKSHAFSPSSHQKKVSTRLGFRFACLYSHCLVISKSGIPFRRQQQQQHV